MELPGSMSLSVVNRMTFAWSFVEAARSMPWDSIPRSFLGARFAMIMIFLFWSSSFV